MHMLIAPVPTALATAIAPYRQKFDPLANIIPPHITILKPFHFTGPAHELYNHIESILENYAPIKVSLAGWDIYDQSRYQLRLPVVAGRREFRQLRQDLLTGPLNHPLEVDNAPWPYITFGRFPQRDDLEEAKKILQGFEPQFVFRVAYLELLCRSEPTQPWQTQKTFGLKATLQSQARRANSANNMKTAS